MKQIYISLTTEGSIEKAIKSLENYKTEIHQKTQLFLDRLMEAGITTAKANTGVYGSYIAFEKQISRHSDGYEAILVGRDSQKITRVWYTNKARTVEKSYEVSPILLAEFGSGWLANVLDEIDGVGQGTMPGQVHAFDQGGWFWYDEDGTKHHSKGEAPTYPMHKAFITMAYQIDKIGREVFNG